MPEVMVILATHTPKLPFSVNIAARSGLCVGENAYTCRFCKSAFGTRTFQPHRNPFASDAALDQFPSKFVYPASTLAMSAKKPSAKVG